MAKKIMTVDEAQDHGKWLELRNHGIGGSDAATIVGINPWKGAYELYLEKTRQVEPEDISMKEAVYWGIVLEEPVAKRFTEVTGKRVHRCGTLQDDEYPFLLANVDRMVQGENAGLEIKTARFSKEKEWKDDEVPDTYYLQCQHYMMVTGCERWYIACLLGGQHFVWKAIERNDDDIKALREAEVSFWLNNVEKLVPPPVDGSEACSKALTGMYPGGDKNSLISLEAFADKIEKIKTLEGVQKNLKEEIDELKNSIKNEMGDTETGVCGDYKITWRSQAGRVTIDSKKLKAELPDVYAKYSKQGNPIRVFAIK